MTAAALDRPARDPSQRHLTRQALRTDTALGELLAANRRRSQTVQFVPEPVGQERYEIIDVKTGRVVRNVWLLGDGSLLLGDPE